MFHIYNVNCSKSIYKAVPPKILIRGCLKIKCKETTIPAPIHCNLSVPSSKLRGIEVNTRVIITAPGINLAPESNHLGGSFLLKTKKGRALVKRVAKPIINIDRYKFKGPLL